MIFINILRASVLVPALILIFSIVAQPVYVRASSMESSDKLMHFNIVLSNQSNPRFAVCNTTEPSGNSTLHSLNVSQSINTVLADSDPDSYTVGKVLFGFASNENSTILDEPRMNVTITEIGKAEPFNVTIQTDTNNPTYRSYLPAPTGTKNGCGQSINNVSFDLLDFNITNGSTVKWLLFDNLGEQRCCNGSELSDISIGETSTSPAIAALETSNSPANAALETSNSPANANPFFWFQGDLRLRTSVDTP
jgi:hypothetical protein